MRWSKEELEIGTKLVRSGSSYKEIAEILNRSESSTRNKLFKNGEKSSLYKSKNTFQCLNCKKEFQDDRCRSRKFCSHSCSTTFLNLKKGILSKKINNCLNCGGIARNKFCNNNCQIEYERNIIFEEIENGNKSFYCNTYKKYLISKFGEKCMECGWNRINLKTNKVPIQLEHIDGNSENNKLENLKLLCPNCHSLTLTYGALNKGNGRKK